MTYKRTVTCSTYIVPRPITVSASTVLPDPTPTPTPSPTPSPAPTPTPTPVTPTPTPTPTPIELGPYEELYEKSVSGVFARVRDDNLYYPTTPIAPEYLGLIEPTYEGTGLGFNNIDESDLVVYPDDQRNITTDDLVLEGYLFQGIVRVKAKNVTFRNCLFENYGTYGIDTEQEGQENTVVEYCDFRKVSSAAIYGSGFTAYKNRVYDVGGDAFKCISNVLVEGNYLNRLGYDADAHADGVQMVTGSNVIIRGNFFDMIANDYIAETETTYKNTQCIIISTNTGSISDIQIYENFFRGAVVALNIRDKGLGYGAPYNCLIIRNTFYDDSWQSSPFRIENIGNSYSQNQVWGNVLLSTGELIEGQGEEPT